MENGEPCQCMDMFKPQRLSIEYLKQYNITGEKDQARISNAFCVGYGFGEKSKENTTLRKRVDELRGLKDYAIESNRINAERAEKAEAEAKRLQDACYVWQAKVEKTEAEVKRLREGLETISWVSDECSLVRVRQFALNALKKST